MRFEFATANRIIFGAGTRRQLTNIAAKFGQRPLLVTGKNNSRAKFALSCYLPLPMNHPPMSCGKG